MQPNMVKGYVPENTGIYVIKLLKYKHGNVLTMIYYISYH